VGLKQVRKLQDRSEGMSGGAGLDAFEGKRYLNLESYRRSGKGVRTPVWFAAAAPDAGGPKLYVYTTSDSGKAKRIRRTGVVRIAPCDSRGKVTGGWVPARAEIVNGEEFDRGMELINRKYRPWKQILDLSIRVFSGHPRVVISIRRA
jgi:PPOX class probable F420-dependent enzyme